MNRCGCLSLHAGLFPTKMMTTLSVQKLPKLFFVNWDRGFPREQLARAEKPELLNLWRAEPYDDV
jgi:hypothetical protein